MTTKIKLLLAALLCTGMVSAQVSLGTLKGKVIDEDHKTIPSAKLILEGSGKTFRMVSDLDGYII